ncbi:FtsH protease activity modulator HflK [bacterium]|nr:FtsH protease activity modulator HflK [bacterium]
MSDRDIRAVKMPDFKPPNIKFGWVVGGIVTLLLLVLALDTFFTIDPEEVGVVQTFGAYSRTVPPGIGFKLPRPIQRVTKLPVQRQLKEEFGFRTVQADVRSRYDPRDFLQESLMLTGDLNVAEVEWITQYRIDDPYLFMFKVRNPVDTLRDMNEAVIRTVVGDRSVNEVLTTGRQEIASEVERRLKELCEQYEIGLSIEQIVLQDVNPPDDVKPSFNEVNQAQQEKERLINLAQQEFNKVVPRASGEAEQMIQEAEGYATERVNRAQGDVAGFSAVLDAYERSPDVTRRRIYLETMQAVLPQIRRKVILDSDLKGLLPLLNLSEEVKKP